MDLVLHCSLGKRSSFDRFGHGGLRTGRREALSPTIGCEGGGFRGTAFGAVAKIRNPGKRKNRGVVSRTGIAKESCAQGHRGQAMASWGRGSDIAADGSRSSPVSVNANFSDFSFGGGIRAPA